MTNDDLNMMFEWAAAVKAAHLDMQSLLVAVKSDLPDLEAYQEADCIASKAEDTGESIADVLKSLYREVDMYNPIYLHWKKSGRLSTYFESKQFDEDCRLFNLAIQSDISEKRNDGMDINTTINEVREKWLKWLHEAYVVARVVARLDVLMPDAKKIALELLQMLYEKVEWTEKGQTKGVMRGVIDCDKDLWLYICGVADKPKTHGKATWLYTPNGKEVLSDKMSLFNLLSEINDEWRAEDLLKENIFYESDGKTPIVVSNYSLYSGRHKEQRDKYNTRQTTKKQIFYHCIFPQIEELTNRLHQAKRK